MKESKNVSTDTSQLSKETLLKILDNSYDAIFATDGKGVTIYANKACEKYFGIKPSDVIGIDSWQFMEKVGCYPPTAPITLHSRDKHTLEQTTRTGAKMLVTNNPIYDQGGNIELLVQNCRDVKQLEDTKRDLEQTKELLARMQDEVVALRKKELRNVTLVANSSQMQELLQLVDRVAAVDINILILGETGTGKSALAKHIHKSSSRKDGPFISINCAAIPDELIESELFGYMAGAFTGALQKGKTGLVELADGGTLFLDEIAELPLRLQGKILSVIQERRFIPVGGRQEKETDCRIISATNRNIEDMIEQGSFREDLYYRLNVIEMELRPLRERPDDTMALIYYFLNQFNKKYKKEHSISPECRDILLDYSWPGNIRELENMIERLVVVVEDSVINVCHLPKVFSEAFSKKIQLLEVAEPQASALDTAVIQVERKMVVEAFRKYGSSRKVAHALNISQSRAHRLIEKYCNYSETISNSQGIHD
ncbi:sigma-54 interaction domain-containing protein [Sporomusa malonica]|uniref:HTH-type transcriptional regulatory protein TyrR n=1 Tax=Sporomusa malonica TaxID=112901 RepID=A0A1W2EQ03_9FIRM|nr:sigma 54-interacting transcriptional regulator [Sporomusa malonica]SMD11755.1 PAS domain S-box-containing protein [Sporomusa malonica]